MVLLQGWLDVYGNTDGAGIVCVCVCVCVCVWHCAMRTQAQQWQKHHEKSHTDG